MQDFKDRFTDENLNAFRLRSDQAFAAMQRRADSAMERFLQRYGNSSLDSYQRGLSASAGHSQGSAQVMGEFKPNVDDPRASSLAGTLGIEIGLGTKAQSPSESAGVTNESLYEPVRDQAGPSSRRTEWTGDIKNDFELLTGGLRSDAEDIGKEAMRGSKDILKSTRSELGQMAKQEAAELRAAAQRALQEEKDLRALRGRAQEEMKAAQERLRSRAEELKESALENVEGLATGALQRMKQAGAQRLGIDLQKPPEQS